MSVQRIEVVYHEEDGTWWAEAPEFRGYSAANPSLTTLRVEVREGLAFFVDDDVELDERFAAPSHRTVTAKVTFSGFNFNGALLEPLTVAPGHSWVTKHQLTPSRRGHLIDGRPGSTVHEASH